MLTRRYHLWIWASIACWGFPTVLAVLTALGHHVPALCYVGASASAFAATILGAGGRALEELHRANSEAVVIESFQHGYALRSAHCATSCTQTEATILEFPRVVGQDWDGVDPNATTVQLPRLPIGRRPAPRRRRR